MIRELGRFATALRRAGLRVSTAEWLDAMRAIERLGVADRDAFRLALRCTLAKDRRGVEAFDEAFGRFFVAPAARRRRRGAGGAAAGEPGGRGPAGSGTRGGHSRTDEPGAPPARSTAVRSAPARRRGTESRAWLEGVSGARRQGRLRRVLAASPEERAEHAAQGSGAAPDRRDLRAPTTLDGEREIAREVARVVERLRLRPGRRLLRSRRGTLYLRTLFRDNLSSGGVPFVLPRRRPRLRRTRFVLLVDVSWSVARAAGLFLSIAAEFFARSARTRVVLFVDRAIDATPVVARWVAARPGGAPRGPHVVPRRASPGEGIVRGGVPFSALLRGLEGLALDAPSDYGRTMDALARGGRLPGGRGAALVVLGDARNNGRDPQAWAFEELASRFGFVAWIVPEPVVRWGTGDSDLDAYLPSVDLAVEARDLEGLARGVSRIVARG